MHDDYTNITDDINKLEKRIAKLKNKFSEKQDLLQFYEKSLADNQEVYNAYLKSKATQQLLLEYQTKVGANIAEIERLGKETSDIKKQLAGYNEERAQTNNIYQTNLSKLLMDLDVPKDQVEEEIEPGTAIIASGAYGPRCKVAQNVIFCTNTKEKMSRYDFFPLSN